MNLLFIHIKLKLHADIIVFSPYEKFRDRDKSESTLADQQTIAEEISEYEIFAGIWWLFFLKNTKILQILFSKSSVNRLNIFLKL